MKWKGEMRENWTIEADIVRLPFIQPSDSVGAFFLKMKKFLKKF